ncbi:tetratricopeptide repeat protein [Fictibacillus barbaricus]|uniref:Tetratricopeptide repeat protein n=1 Tax=Fictibacillus barbaricus TaxID=182136 RepID=A0ABS2ZJ08_9BACL|nr:tetratricopeptide repeat protein [Fictibacillus barbaricus]MBN3546589.1 tetratricopeptide repeat protein [Fictibacillus barbaricus]GGB42221.1 hypothetical protein GCM10007199_04390 [Fictibacillus barbaricus]
MFNINTNQKAIDQLEKNNLQEAMKLFKKAVLERRDVQSLTNLAWMYLHEEEDVQAALVLVTEAIELEPYSHFPYSLYGELLLRYERFEEALKYLLISISIEPTPEAYHNVGVAKYYLGDSAEAAKYFGLAAGKSDFTLYNQVECLIDSGQTDEAKRILGTFDENDEDFIGEIDLAELYAELGLFEEAIIWFEKGWESYYKTPDWIVRFVNALFKTNQLNKAQILIKEAIQLKEEELCKVREDETDEDWTELDKQEQVRELMDEIKEYESMIERVTEGVLPALKIEPSIEGGCYLFGCQRHEHDEYKHI